STLKADTLYENQKISDILVNTTPENAKESIEKLLNVKFDYYILMEYDKFCDIYNKLGAVNYTVLSDIKYKNSTSAFPYSLKIKAGEQTIEGKQAVSLIRYYLEEENNASFANDVMLCSLSQQINKNNVANSEELFELFIMNSQTNITVKDFSLAEDNLTVLSDERTSASVYSASAEYDKNTITQDSLRSIKSYFAK
ncbi:MAG: LCP family protein, partial [Eubacterium sp.]